MGTSPFFLSANKLDAGCTRTKGHAPTDENESIVALSDGFDRLAAARHDVSGQSEILELQERNSLTDSVMIDNQDQLLGLKIGCV